MLIQHVYGQAHSKIFMIERFILKLFLLKVSHNNFSMHLPIVDFRAQK